MDGRGLKRIFSGFALVTAAQAVTTVAAVGLYTRLLDPAAYGRYALALAAALLLQSMLFAWLHAGMVRFHEPARKDPAALAGHLATSWISFSAVAAAVAMLAGLAALWVGTPAVAVGSYLIARAGLSLALEEHRMAGRVRRYAVLEIGQAAVGLAVGCAWAVAAPLDGAAPLFGMAVGCAVSLLADGRGVLAALAGRLSRRHLGVLLAYGLPMGVAALTQTLGQLADRFLVAALLDEAATGLYAVAVSAADRPMTLVFSWLGMSSLPVVLAAYERQGKAGAQAEIARMGRLVLLIGLPAAAGLAMVARPLAAVLVGPDFRDPVAELLPWIAAAALLNGVVGYYLAIPLMIQRRSGSLAAIQGGAAVLGIGLDLVLIPRCGLWGAALSSLLAFLAAALAAYALVRPWMAARRLLDGALRCLAAVAMMVMTLAWLPLPNGAAGLAPAILAGATVYAATAWLFDAAEVRSLFQSRDWD